MDRIRGRMSVQYEELDRRSPVDPRILFGGLLAVLIGVAVATSGFGLIGGGSSDSATESTATTEELVKVKVAVFNGTAAAPGEVGVPEVADKASKLVKSIDGDVIYKVGAVSDAGSFPETVVMFTEGSKSDARELAESLAEPLGEQPALELMSADVEAISEGADVALIVGQDNAAIE